MTEIEKENRRKKNIAATKKFKASFLQTMRAMSVENEAKSSQNDITYNDQYPSENKEIICNNYDATSSSQSPS